MNRVNEFRNMNTTIHIKSFHPISNKLAAYRLMIHCLLNVPLTSKNFS